jgi:hypothetical protein
LVKEHFLLAAAKIGSEEGFLVSQNEKSNPLILICPID